MNWNGLGGPPRGFRRKWIHSSAMNAEPTWRFPYLEEHGIKRPRASCFHVQAAWKYIAPSTAETITQMTPLPPTMRSLAVTKYSRPSEYEVIDLPLPEIKNPDEVLIRVHAGAINTADTQVANGAFRLFEPLPCVVQPSDKLEHPLCLLCSLLTINIGFLSGLEWKVLA